MIDQGQARLTARIEAGALQQLDAQIAAAALSARRGDAVLAQAGQVQLAATATPVAAADPAQAGGWNVEVSRLALSGSRGAWPAATAQLQLRPQPAGWTLDAHADFLRLDDLMPWAALNPALPAAARVGGDLSALHLQLGAPVADGGAAPRRPMTLDAQLRQIALKPQDDQPALSGLEGTLHVEDENGRLSLRDAAPTLSLPTLFTQPIVVDRISGDFAWQHSAGGWRVSTPAFAATLPGAQARGSLDLLLPGDGKTPPRMRLVAELAQRGCQPAQGPDAADLGRENPRMARPRAGQGQSAARASAGRRSPGAAQRRASGRHALVAGARRRRRHSGVPIRTGRRPRTWPRI